MNFENRFGFDKVTTMSLVVHFFWNTVYKLDDCDFSATDRHKTYDFKRNNLLNFYSARNARIASAVLAIAIPSVRPSVSLSVRPSHAGIVSKRRHVARCSLHRWIAKCV